MIIRPIVVIAPVGNPKESFRRPSRYTLRSIERDVGDDDSCCSIAKPAMAPYTAAYLVGPRIIVQFSPVRSRPLVGRNARPQQEAGMEGRRGHIVAGGWRDLHVRPPNAFILFSAAIL